MELSFESVFTEVIGDDSADEKARDQEKQQ